jgi:hypothetical protein
MRVCSKCNKPGEFRKRKNRKGIFYEISICWECERIQKNIAELKRYHSLTVEQKTLHNNLAKLSQTKESYKSWRRRWQKEREKTNISFLVKRRVGALLRNGLFKQGYKTFDLLGYTPTQLINHLEGLFEPWMTWDNWGVYNPNSWNNEDSSTWTWQIDHIKPISDFSITDFQDPMLRVCWALDNLRPLSAKENILKSNKTNS